MDTFEQLMQSLMPTEVDPHQHLLHRCQVRDGMAGKPVTTMCGKVAEHWWDSHQQPKCPDCVATIGEPTACPVCGVVSLVNPSS